jgi:hypothetical protein
MDHFADPLDIVTELRPFLPLEDDRGIFHTNAGNLADGCFPHLCKLAKVIRAGEESKEPEIIGFTGDLQKSRTYRRSRLELFRTHPLIDQQRQRLDIV